NEQHLLAGRDNYIPVDKIDLLSAAVMQSCDAADGVHDNLIQDPRRCKFDPASLLCRNGDNSDCLTRGQVATVNAFYAGPSTVAGNQVYSGLTKSDPGEADGWPIFITDFDPPNALGASQPWVDPLFPPIGFIEQDQFLKYLVFSDPDYNSLTFNFNNSDLARAQ